jgi:hypothetical protein
MDFKKYALRAGSVLLALALYAAWLWQPERQVRLHTAHFLKAVERRNWDGVQGFVSDKYSDRWGHDKEIVVREAREVFRQFVLLTVQNETVACDVAAGTGIAHTRVKLAGNGGPLAQFAVEKVNRLREPFVFEWRSMSWKPWDWRLVRVDHPELDLDLDHAF